MENLLFSAAIGDICGMYYEFKHRTKNYDEIKLVRYYTDQDYTDDTVCTFACAEALINGLDVAENLRKRCREDIDRGYGGRFRKWLMDDEIKPAYGSYGNGSAMRVSAAGFLAQSENECIELATRTAMPTHNHPEGIKGAVATALTIFYSMEGWHKEYIKEKVLGKYYPEWLTRTYADIKPDYEFSETCQLTVPAAIICFLESEDYADCLKLAISLGGDADTLAAIAGPMAYAYYKEMPKDLIWTAEEMLPNWMLIVDWQFDLVVQNSPLKHCFYYKGEEEAPKNTENEYFGLWWSLEKSFYGYNCNIGVKEWLERGRKMRHPSEIYQFIEDNRWNDIQKAFLYKAVITIVSMTFYDPKIILGYGKDMELSKKTENKPKPVAKSVEQFLIEKCRYYKGGKRNPYEWGTAKAHFWELEWIFVNSYYQTDRKLVEQYESEFRSVFHDCLTDAPYGDIFIPLKAFLHARYYDSGGSDAGFPAYLDYYLKNQ